MRTATNDSTNCTSHYYGTKATQEISQHSQLHNAQKDVDIERVAANKSKYFNPDHFNISYFRNSKPFSLFGFTFMQLIL